MQGNNEFLKFLKKLDTQTDKALDVHLIVDNYATHKHPNVKEWLTTHPHFHFTPTSASWVNLVECFFRDITEEQVCRGVFRSVDELEVAIKQVPGTSQYQPQAIPMDRHSRGNLG